MQNNENQKTYFIYVRSTGEKVPVTKEQHDSFYKEADRIRHKEQDHGRCMCPYSRYAVDKGYIPIAPHLLFPQFLDDDNPDERELGLFFGNALMSKCAEVWVFGSRISSGMEAEIKRAKWKGYHLRYFTEECQEV